MVYFFPTRFHIFDQLKETERNGHVFRIFSIYPNRRLQQGIFAALAEHNQTLWLSLITYLVWRAMSRIGAPRFVQIAARRAYVWTCGAEFTLWLRRRQATTVVSAAGYLGPFAKTLQRAGHRVVVNHGSLYEGFVADYLKNSAKLDANTDLANWVNSWLIARMDAEFATSDLIIVCSSLAQRCLPKPWRAKSAVVPLGAPDWALDPSDRSPKPIMPASKVGGTTFLHVSSLVPQKNVGRILDAFAGVRGPGDKMLIGGPPPRDAALCTRLSKEPGVTYLGRLDRDQLRAALQSADVFVHPSLSDGWAMTVTEALGSGLPVVSSTLTGAADFYHAALQGTAYAELLQLVDPLSTTALEAALERSKRVAVAHNRAPIDGLVTWQVSGERLIWAIT
jgi:glycosyltransferase involved in cell wall biosynthesis